MPPEEQAPKVLLARRLRSARDASGLTQAQVAKKLGLHRPSIAEIEAGRRNVAGHELKLMADLYAVSVNWLTATEEAELDVPADHLVLAARELSKLKDEDIDRLVKLLHFLRKSGTKP
jgi:transcriptional regulator with XRE-family HTH domain